MFSEVFILVIDGTLAEVNAGYVFVAFSPAALLGALGVSAELHLCVLYNVPSRKVGIGPPQSPVTHEVFHPKWKTGCLWLRYVVAMEQTPFQGCRALAGWRRMQLLVV